MSCPKDQTPRVLGKRGALELDALGGIVADKLIERGLVDEPLDIFGLQFAELSSLNLGTARGTTDFGREERT